MNRTQPVPGLLAGLLAGLISAAVAAATGTDFAGTDQQWLAGIMHIIISTLAGAIYVALFDPRNITDGAEHATGGLVYGILLWLVLALNLLPVLQGAGTQWTIEEVTAAFPLLIIYLVRGIVTGVTSRVIFTVAGERFAVEAPAPATVTPEASHRIVILGGGFAGVTAAQTLEKRLANDPTVSITLISNTNHLLFTPMLSEVVSGSVEPQHVSTPLRSFFRHVEIICNTPEHIDFEARTVTLAAGAGDHRALPFDHLVLAVGSVPNFFGNPGLERHALTFKSLADAERIRTRVIETLERADAEPDPGRRRALVTYVVAGGGFAGAELIGSLNDFVRGSLWYYPHIPPDDVRLILVHARDRILPELSAESAEYARENMAARGVTFYLNSRLTGADAGDVTINDETIPTETVIWTAGNMPNPILRDLGCAVNERGAARVDEHMRVVEHSGVWAVGDCGAIPNAHTGEFAPPTAQHALREAKTVAFNIVATLRDEPLEVFSHESLGALAVLGHQTACAELSGMRFSGLMAWFIWRGIYLSKLPSLQKKVRVLLDWVVDIFFPRDLASYQPLTHADPEIG